MRGDVTLIKWCFALTLAGTASVVAAPFSPPQPTLKSNVNLICPGGKLDRGRLAIFYFANDKVAAAFPGGPDDLLSALRAPDNQTGQRREIANAIDGQIQFMITRPASGFQTVTPAGSTGVPDFFAASPAQLMVNCNKNNVPANPTPDEVATNPPAQPWQPGKPQDDATAKAGLLDNLRIRGNTDALLISPKSLGFKSAAAATVSYSENGTTKTTTNALQAAIGYDFSIKASPLTSFDIIPFVAVDRNMSVASGKLSASSRENIMLGVTGAMVNGFLGPGGASDVNTISITYQHIWNDINNSELEFVHFLDQPIIGPFGYLFLNNFSPILAGATLGDALLGITPLFDLRGDLGFYSKPAAMASTTRNYQQLGSNFGIDIASPRYKTDLMITETLMAELQHYRKGVSLFDVELTYNITDNAGIKASYQNGNLETTGQRVQQWLLSLSLKL